VANTDLRRGIEDLAVRLVLADESAGPDGGPPEWIENLERLRAAAAAADSAEVQHEAAGLIAGLGHPGALSPEEGITRLQQALDRDEQSAAPAVSPLAADPELMGDFVMESREHLAAIEAQIMTLERDPANSEALNAVFRGFHTIKGLAGFLELPEVQALSHEVETLLVAAREGRCAIDAAAADVVLESADYLKRWLDHLEAQLHQRPSEPPATDRELTLHVRELVSQARPQPETAAGGPAEEVPRPEATPPTGAAQDGSDAGLRTLAGAVAVAPPVRDAAPPAAADRSPEVSPAVVARQEATAVRVETAKLDYLADMAGEMVIAESLVRHDPDLAGVRSPQLQRKMAQMARITAELQRTAMAMRLVPIGPLFHRMARLVRDLSRQVGKHVELETQGSDIELDRSIVEELGDPLMHMVRNSLDHGIETPEERRAAGKPAESRLALRAMHHAGQVLIEISDDGRGLNRAKILEKAVQKGLVSAGEELTDTQVYNLIFEPGFTTATKVTSVSGRGVGMDVVHKHIEKLRGRIEIRSTPGVGATFLLKLPLTLAIIDGLVVGVGGERYIVPLFAVREMFRPGPDTVWTVHGKAEMALVRGALLPVVRLYRKFGVVPRSEDARESLLLVAEAEGERFCLLVDELIGKQEVVIKSLGETFSLVTGIAGGAIMGDGRVGLILDLDRLSKDRA
jgi:two-component system, chemotaxis family, sensor kinase CheA